MSRVFHVPDRMCGACPFLPLRFGGGGSAEQGVEQRVIRGVEEPDVRLVGFITNAEVTKRWPRSAPCFALTSEFHTAAPLEHREYVINAEGRCLEFPLTDFHVMKLTARTVIPDGHARLEAVWKPMGQGEGEGGADVLQVLFITADEVLLKK